MKELLEYLARGLVGSPDAVRVTRSRRTDSLVLELAVGRGRLRQRDRSRRTHGERAARRDQGAAVQEQRRVFLDIVDA